MNYDTVGNREDDIKPVVHILITSLCNRDCTYCCNKQYDMDSIPYVTDEELSNTDTVCLTGGEPFAYSNPNNIARWLKSHYPNIRNVYAYTNSLELCEYIDDNGKFDWLDGLSVSIKDKNDLKLFELYVDSMSKEENLSSNLLYVFGGLYPNATGNFKIIDREWQKEFKPADNSIFRRL